MGPRISITREVFNKNCSSFEEQSVTVEQGTLNEVEPHYARQKSDCEQLISIILEGRRRLLRGATPVIHGTWTG